MPNTDATWKHVHTPAWGRRSKFQTLGGCSRFRFQSLGPLEMKHLWEVRPAEARPGRHGHLGSGSPMTAWVFKHWARHSGEGASEPSQVSGEIFSSVFGLGACCRWLSPPRWTCLIDRAACRRSRLDLSLCDTDRVFLYSRKPKSRSSSSGQKSQK